MDLPSVFGSNFLLASALTGTLIPAGIAIINQRRWSSEVKGIVAALCCLGAAAVLAYTQAQLTAQDVLRSFLIVFTLATVLYRAFWQPSGLAGRIESGTTL